MTLEDKLVENLVNTYKMKGKNVQGVLMNPIFNGLSLSEKIKMIDRYAVDLARTPIVDHSTVVPGALLGGVLALTGSAGRMLMMGGPLKDVNVKLALGAGALIGGAASYLQSRREYNQSREIADSIGNPYSTIVLNSMHQPVARPDVGKLHELASMIGVAQLDADKPQ